jgi:hypothetical protein
MRNLALAVLWTVISLSGLSDLDNSPGDFDDGDDGGVECLELHRGGERSPSRVLEAASDVCGKPIESAWVARDGHGRCAAAAVQHTEDYSFVVSVTLDGRDDGPARIAAAALEGALDHCREAGALKVIIQGRGERQRRCERSPRSGVSVFARDGKR